MTTFAELAASLGLTAEEALAQRNEIRNAAILDALITYSASVASIPGSKKCGPGKCGCPSAYSMCRFRVREMQHVAVLRGYDMRIVEHGGWGLPGQDLIDIWEKEAAR